MEEDGQEWVCPKCKKAERAMKGYGLPGKKSADGSENELPEILRHSITKNGSQAGNRSVMLQEGQTIPKRIVVGEKKVEIQQTRQPVTKKGSRDGHFTPVKLYNDKKMDASTIIPVSPPKNLNGGKEVRNICLYNMVGIAYIFNLYILLILFSFHRVFDVCRSTVQSTSFSIQNLGCWIRSLVKTKMVVQFFFHLAPLFT